MFWKILLWFFAGLAAFSIVSGLWHFISFYNYCGAVAYLNAVSPPADTADYWRTQYDYVELCGSGNDIYWWGGGVSAFFAVSLAVLIRKAKAGQKGKPQAAT